VSILIGDRDIGSVNNLATETIPSQAMPKFSQPSPILPVLNSQSHPFLVSCSFLYHPYIPHFLFGEFLFAG